MRLKIPACSHGLVFLVTSPQPGAIQQPTRSHYNRKNNAQGALMTQEIARVWGDLCQGQGQRQILQEMFLVFLSLRNLQGLGALFQEQRQKPIYVFVIISHQVYSNI